MSTPPLTVHMVPPSHPSHAVIAALELKGLEYERVDLDILSFNAEMESIYGEGRTTVPGMLIGDERVHTSRAIFARLEEIVPEPPLFPPDIADEVREAERWGDEELQDLGRRLPWGAMYFRPEAAGTFAGGGPLDPAGTDYSIRFIRASWKYHRIGAVQLAEDLAGLPAKLEHIDSLTRAGIVGGESPNAADLQIGSTIRILLTVEDLHPLLHGSAAEQLALRWFGEYHGLVPAGAFPAGWVPAGG